MMPLAKEISEDRFSYTEKDALAVLFGKLDEAIDDVERLPSGKFDTNELVLELTVLAYNCLRLIGQESLKSKRSPKTKRPVRRRRLRTVINDLILIASHVTKHSRKVILSLGRSNIWRYAFLDVYRHFVSE